MTVAYRHIQSHTYTKCHCKHHVTHSHLFRTSPYELLANKLCSVPQKKNKTTYADLCRLYAPGCKSEEARTSSILTHVRREDILRWLSIESNALENKPLSPSPSPLSKGLGEDDDDLPTPEAWLRQPSALLKRSHVAPSQTQPTSVRRPSQRQDGPVERDSSRQPPQTSQRRDNYSDPPAHKEALHADQPSQARPSGVNGASQAHPQPNLSSHKRGEYGDENPHLEAVTAERTSQRPNEYTHEPSQIEMVSTDASSHKRERYASEPSGALYNPPAEAGSQTRARYDGPPHVEAQVLGTPFKDAHGREGLTCRPEEALAMRASEGRVECARERQSELSGEEEGAARLVCQKSLASRLRASLLNATKSNSSVDLLPLVARLLHEELKGAADGSPTSDDLDIFGDRFVQAASKQETQTTIASSSQVKSKAAKKRQPLAGRKSESKYDQEKRKAQREAPIIEGVCKAHTHLQEEVRVSQPNTHVIPFLPVREIGIQCEIACLIECGVATDTVARTSMTLAKRRAKSLPPTQDGKRRRCTEHVLCTPPRSLRNSSAEKTIIADAIKGWIWPSSNLQIIFNLRDASRSQVDEFDLRNRIDQSVGHGCLTCAR